MYFEACLMGRKYKLDVIETVSHWKIGIQQENKAWSFCNIPKSDFQSTEKSISFLFQGSSYLIDIIGSNTEFNVYTRGSYRNIQIYNEQMLLHESLKHNQVVDETETLLTKIPGKILQIFVKPGEKIEAGQPLLIIEAMKMENELLASGSGCVKEIRVSVGQNVDAGTVLVVFE